MADSRAHVVRVVSGASGAFVLVLFLGAHLLTDASPARAAVFAVAATVGLLSALHGAALSAVYFGLKDSGVDDTATFLQFVGLEVFGVALGVVSGCVVAG